MEKSKNQKNKVRFVVDVYKRQIQDQPRMETPYVKFR